MKKIQYNKINSKFIKLVASQLGKFDSPKEEVDYKNMLLSDFVNRSRHLGEENHYKESVELRDTLFQDRLDSRIISSISSKEIEIKEFDSLILCVTESEFEAIRDAFGFEAEIESPNQTLGDASVFFESLYLDTYKEHNVLFVLSNSPTNIAINNLVNQIFIKFRVEQAFLVGMVAGLEERLKLGHVAVSDKVYYKGGGKLQSGTKTQRPELVEGINTLYFRELLEGIHDFYRKALPNSNIKLNFLPKEFQDEKYRLIYKKGYISSSETLIADDNYMSAEAGFDQRIKCVDMESYGFATSCNANKVKWLIMKSSSDYGSQSDRGSESVLNSDDEKYKTQYACTLNAALLLKYYLIQHYFESTKTF